MVKEFQKRPTLKSSLIPIVLIFLSTACLSSGKLVTMNFSETNLNLLFGDPVYHFPEKDLSLSTTNLDVLDNTIRVNGELIDGQSTHYPGYFDVGIWIEEGAVAAEIKKINFSGISINDELTSYIEERIEDNIESAVSRSGERFTFEEIQFVRDGVQVRIRIAPAPSEVTR